MPRPSRVIPISTLPPDRSRDCWSEYRSSDAPGANPPSSAWPSLLNKPPRRDRRRASYRPSAQASEPPIPSFPICGFAPDRLWAQFVPFPGYSREIPTKRPPVLALPAKGVLNDDEQSRCFPAERVLPSRKRDGSSRESARRSWPRQWEDAQEDGPYLEQRCPQTNRRSTKTTLGEGPKGRRQAGEVISTAMLSQAPQPASFVTSRKHCGRGQASETARFLALLTPN